MLQAVSIQTPISASRSGPNSQATTIIIEEEVNLQAITLLEDAIDKFIPMPYREEAIEGIAQATRFIEDDRKLDLAEQVARDLGEIASVREQELEAKARKKLYSLNGFFAGLRAHELFSSLAQSFQLPYDTSSYLKKLYKIASGGDVSEKERYTRREVNNALQALSIGPTQYITNLANKLLDHSLELLMESYSKNSNGNKSLGKLIDEIAYELFGIEYASLDNKEKTIFRLYVFKHLRSEANDRIESLYYELIVGN